MANLADLTLAFWVPCEHCDAMLYGRVKFCPYCGEAESAILGADAAKAALEPQRATPDRADTVAAIPADWVVMPPQEEQEQTPPEEVGSEVARLAPAPFEWQMDLAAPGTALSPALESPPGAERKRPATGKVAALVLLALALVLGAVYFNDRMETEKSGEFRAKLAQAQSALGRGDLSAAQRALAALVAARPDHPGVQEFRNEVDQRMREQAAQSEQLREAALNAAKALSLDEPALSPSKPPPAAEAPAIIAAPAPRMDAAQPTDNECSDVLAALALCTKGPVSEAALDTPQVKGER